MNLSLFTKTILPGLLALNLTAQPGIYTESDIEYQSMFIDAKLAAHKGEIDTQIDLLKDIIRINRNEHAAYFELAKAYEGKAAMDQAYKHISSALEIAPENVWYHIKATDIAEASFRYDKAVQHLQHLINLQPREKEHHLRLARNQYKSENWDAAAATLEKWQAMHGIDEESSRQLFDIYFEYGREDKALDVLRNLSETYPGNTRFMINLAGFLNDLGRSDEATTIYQRVLELDPENPAATMALVRKDVPSREAGSYLESLYPVMNNMNIPLDNKIRELMPFISTMSADGNDTPALLKISEDLVHLYPEEAKVFAVRGDVLFYAGNYKEAEKAYAKSISLDDRQYILWDQWMINLWELEDYEKLDKVSYDAVDLFPNQVNAYILRSLAMAQNGQPGEAREYAEEANFIAAGSPAYESALLILQSWLHASAIEATHTRDKLSRISLDDLPNSIFLELMGDIYYRIGEKGLAVRLWEKAVERGADPARMEKKPGV